MGNGAISNLGFIWRNKGKLSLAAGTAFSYPYVKPVIDIGIKIYEFSKKHLGGWGTLLAGTALGAIAIAAFSNITSLVKKAATLAIAGIGLYLGASFLFNRSANALAPSGTAAFDFDNLFDLKQLWRTLTGAKPNNAITTTRHTVDPAQLPKVPAKSPLDASVMDGDETSQIAKAKNAAKAIIAKGPAAIAKELKAIIASAKSARLGGNIPALGVGIGIGAAAITTYAFLLQRAYAEALHKEGTITAEAKKSYMELSYLNQGILTGDIALSIVDPTGLSIIATLGAENGTYGNFQDWIDNNASNLTSEQAAGLSMSLFTPDTVSANLLKSVRKNIPDSIVGQPQILHATIEANQNYKTAFQAMLSEYQKNVRTTLNLDRTALKNSDTIRVIQGSSAEVEAIRKTALADGRTETAQALEKYIQLKSKAEIAHKKLVNSLAETAKTPEGMNAYLNITPIADRLELALRLTKSDKSISTHPQIAAYAVAKETWNPFDGRNARNTLTNNPDILNAYIQGRLNPSNPSKAPVLSQIQPRETVAPHTPLDARPT